MVSPVQQQLMVECLLQQDADNVIVAIDLANMFNDVDRDALVDELLRHTRLGPSTQDASRFQPSG